MNVCLVSQHYPPDTAQGGIGTQTWNKSRALAALGHEVHVLACAAGSGPDLATEHQAGVTVHRMQPPGQEPGREFPVYQQVTYSVGYTWSVLRHLSGLIEAASLDVIDFPEYGAEGFAYQVDRVADNWVAVVVQLHAPLALLADHIGWPEKESSLYDVGTFMEGRSIALADGLMACSANIANFAASFYGVPHEAVDVVHCGVDAAAFCPDRERGSSGRRPTVLFVGNVAPSKGIVTLFEAVLRLRARHPDLLLQVAGTGDEGLIEALTAEAHAAGAAANVQFLGFVGRERLPELYRQADVFCSPAQYEGGVANVFLEAMASGCPVIASTAGGAPEAVDDGRTGFIVPPQDAEAVSAALDRILTCPELARRMAEASRRRVEDYFAMDRYIGRVLATYEKAILRSRDKLERMRRSEQ